MVLAFTPVTIQTLQVAYLATSNRQPVVRQNVLVCVWISNAEIHQAKMYVTHVYLGSMVRNAARYAQLNVMVPVLMRLVTVRVVSQAGMAGSVNTAAPQVVPLAMPGMALVLSVWKVSRVEIVVPRVLMVCLVVDVKVCVLRTA